MAKLNDEESKVPIGRDFKYLTDFGQYIEALMIARELARRGGDETITKRLERIGISKDKWYDRLDKLNREFFSGKPGFDIREAIEAFFKAQAGQGLADGYSDLFHNLDVIRKCFDMVRDQKVPKPRIRLGCTPVLCRPILSHVLERFRKKCKKAGHDEPPQIDISIELSGRLEELDGLDMLDVYLTRDVNFGELPSYKMPYCLFCSQEHKASHSGKMEELNETTLVLLGPHSSRKPPLLYPKGEFLTHAPEMSIKEVDIFDKAHDLVACNGPNIATLSFPEILDEEDIREFKLITKHEILDILKKDDGITIGVKHGGGYKHLREVEKKFVALLEEAFEEVFSDLNPIPEDAIPKMSRKRFIYYVRTKEETGDRAWASSEIDWQFLRTGHIKGLHSVDESRGPDGSSRGFNQKYSISGRVIQNSDSNDCQIFWKGIWKDIYTLKDEVYFANFVCTQEALKEGDTIVGTWGGRSNDDHFTPAAGYMIITDRTDRGLGANPTRDEQQRLLRRLRKDIENFELGSAKPSKVQFIPDHWEWTSQESVVEGKAE